MNNDELKRLVSDCLKGDKNSRKQFQERFGDNIYNFLPKTKKFYKHKDQAADFYCYVFEKDRIFKRLSGFDGQRISGKNYLESIVLKSLAKEWRRSESGKSMDMAALDDPDTARIYERQESGKKRSEDPLAEKAVLERRQQMIDLLEQDKFFILQLFYFYELYGFVFNRDNIPASNADIRAYASESRMSIVDVLELVTGFQEELPQSKMKEERFKGSDDTVSNDSDHQKALAEELIRKIAAKGRKTRLDVIIFLAAVWKRLPGKTARKEGARKSRDNAWYMYTKHYRTLARVNAHIDSFEKNDTPELQRLTEERDELERKIGKRLHQIDTITEMDPDAVITTAYKDIADFLGIPIGTVSGRINMARKKFISLFAGSTGSPQRKREAI